MKDKSKLIIKAVISCFSLFGAVFALAAYIVWKYDLAIGYGFLFTIAVVGLQFLLSPAITEFFFKIKFRNEEDFLDENISAFISKTCQDINMPRPKIGIIDDGNPNAFTYGHVPSNARVVVTRGLLDLLDEDELKSVIAHEIGHIKNYDFMVMTFVSMIPMLAYMIYIKTKSQKGNIGFFISMGAYLVYILSGFASLAFSRVREYYADSFAMDCMKSSGPLKSALIKITYGTQSIQKSDRLKESCMAFSGGATNEGFVLSIYKSEDELETRLMKWDVNCIWAKWLELNSTHPLTAKRIAALEGQMDLEERISVNQVLRFAVDVLVNYSHYIWMAFLFLVWLGPNDGSTLDRFTFGFFDLFEKGFDAPFISISLGVLMLLRLMYKSPEGYKEASIRQVLERDDASPVRGIPVLLRGRVIGRGIPGYFLSEDLVLDDGTGIMLLDYNQPFGAADAFFALFESDEVQDKEVVVKGWYRRSTKPYLEIRTLTVEGEDYSPFMIPMIRLFAFMFIGYGLLIMF